MVRQTTGLVLEVKHNRVVVLTAEGVFAEVPSAQLPAPAQVGDRVTVPLAVLGLAPAHSPATRRQHRLRLLATATAALLFFSFTFGAYRVGAAPAYEVAIDINPSLVLLVDDHNTVRDVRPRNARARLVVKQTPLRGQHVLAAVEAVVAAAADLGFLQPGDPQPAGPSSGDVVLISILPRRADPSLPDIEAMAAHLEAAARRTHTSFRAGIQRVDRKAAMEAARSRLSVNRWALLEQVRERGVQLEPTELRDLPLDELLNIAVQPETDGDLEDGEDRDQNTSPPPDNRRATDPVGDSGEPELRAKGSDRDTLRVDRPSARHRDSRPAAAPGQRGPAGPAGSSRADRGRGAEVRREDAGQGRDRPSIGAETELERRPGRSRRPEILLDIRIRGTDGPSPGAGERRPERGRGRR